MTQHNHSVIVEGCYRCELSKDEVLYSEELQAAEEYEDDDDD